ncbi:NO-inducible flavohemoprotein [Brevibacillus massiliensis]|uniref:NO-inducible flavohemoprotein n=1 Tax=Brevibacillus massiliensis TaxID=1118054 RepID=UPI00030D4604|nr:NO-inducible flavohemoprotein [Brevibacillus massiliensis]
MLSPKTIEVVKSTVPVLETHGKAITTRFYQRLFAQHPELLNIFNHANQKQGRQQTALANAVYAAAAHIDNLGAIMPVVEQIGHKHRSLGIKPEHYPIVGENLLAAIKDVLGDAVTDEIIQAWAEAYGVIADAFISVEAGMYKEAREQRGGWEGWRSFTVAQKVKESDVITSFYLTPEDGGEIADYLPGQYITVKAEIPGEKNTHLRQYSLSDSPGKGYYRISVKREDAADQRPKGVVSSYLHSQVKEGDVLEISAPAGDFVLNTAGDLPVVLLAGGVGFTPLMSMLNSLVERYPGRKVTFIQAATGSSTHAMKEHVAKLVENNSQVTSYTCYSAPSAEDLLKRNFDKQGFVDLPWLKSILPSNKADFYFCGPIPFMKAVYRALKEWEVPQEQIHFEFFGPAGSLEDQTIA